jgi:hypothetical protein
MATLVYLKDHFVPKMVDKMMLALPIRQSKSEVVKYEKNLAWLNEQYTFGLKELILRTLDCGKLALEIEEYRKMYEFRTTGIDAFAQKERELKQQLDKIRRFWGAAAQQINRVVFRRMVKIYQLEAADLRSIPTEQSAEIVRKALTQAMRNVRYRVDDLENGVIPFVGFNDAILGHLVASA